MKFIILNKNKYDFSTCFATYSIPSSVVARIASKNCYLWGHADYLTLFKNNKQEMTEFFEKRKYNKFKKIIFVSEEGRESFIKVFPNVAKKTIVCNNLINSEKIKEQSLEKIEYKKQENTTLFLNVGRHDERQKKLSRLIEAGEKLKKDGYKFQILLIGDGQDTDKYKEFVNKNGEQISCNGYLGKEKPKNYVIYLDGEEISIDWNESDIMIV